MKRHLLAIVVVTVFLSFTSLNPTLADLYLESEQTTRGIPGQPDGTAITRQYISSEAVANDMGDAITLIVFKDKTMYRLDKRTKTYTRASLDKVGTIVQEPGAADEESAAMMKKMMESMADSFKVTPTNEVQTINGYKCRKFIVSLMMLQSEYWASKDFDGYGEIKEISEKTARMFEANPILKQANAMSMMKELDGIPIKTVSNVMGGSIVTQVKKIEKKSLDKSLFQVPADYRLAEEQP